jgi:hypothetical protein
MERISLAGLRCGARLGTAAAALAFAASGAVAAPAGGGERKKNALASHPAPGAHSAHAGEVAARIVTQTVAPSTSLGTEPVARGCYNGGQIVLDNGDVMDAAGYGNPAAIDEYSSNGGSNQQWALCKLPDGYDEIVSDYNGNLMCLNVQNASYVSGEPLLAWQCDTSVAVNEQWRRPENTPDGNYSGFDYLVPAGDYNLCANVAGGFGIGHKFILYSCNSQANEAFAVAGSTTVTDRIGAATYAASYIGYQEEPGTQCNIFSGYWTDGSSCGDGTYAASWCADFDAYVWRFGENVSFNYRYLPGYINGGSASFYSYGQSKGTWHWASSGYTPRPGDVAVYGLNSQGTYADHSALVIGFTPGNQGPNVINGNDSNGGVDFSVDQTSAQNNDTLAGYASPPGL